MQLKKGIFSKFDGGVGNIDSSTELTLAGLKAELKTAICLHALADAVYEAPEGTEEYDAALASYKEAKRHCSTIMPTGTFTSRNLEGLQSLSGLMHIDIDYGDYKDVYDSVDELFDVLSHDKYVRFMAKTASGRGVFLLVEYSPELYDSLLVRPNEYVKEKINTYYRLIVRSFQKYLLDEYGITIDDCSLKLIQPRFIAYSDLVYLNENSAVWNQKEEDDGAVNIKNKKGEYKSITDFGKDKDVDLQFLYACAKYALDNEIDVFKSYAAWQRCALAIANEYGEDGYELFEMLSATRPDDTQAANEFLMQKKYADALQNSRGEVSIGTLKYYLKQALGEQYNRFVSDFYSKKGKDLATANKVVNENKDVVERIRHYFLRNAVMYISPQTLSVLVDICKSFEENSFKVCRQTFEVYKHIDNRYYLVGGLSLNNTDYVDGMVTASAMRLFEKVPKHLKSEIKPLVNKAILHFAGIDRHEIFKANIEATGIKSNSNIDEFLDCLGIDTETLPYEYFRMVFKYYLAGIWHVITNNTANEPEWTGAQIVPVLVGDAGIGKTSFTKVLADKLSKIVRPMDEESREYEPMYSSSAGLPDDDLNLSYELSTKLLYIIDDCSRKELNSNTFRQLVTNNRYPVRILYTSSTVNRIRLAHFIGSTNYKTFINDSIFNRRVAPIPLKAKFGKYAFDKESFENIDVVALLKKCYEEVCEYGYDKFASEVADMIIEYSAQFSNEADVESEIEHQYMYVDIDALNEKLATGADGHLAGFAESWTGVSARSIAKSVQKSPDVIAQMLEGAGIIRQDRRLKNRRRVKQYPLVEIDASGRYAEGIELANYPEIFKPLDLSIRGKGYVDTDDYSYEDDMEQPF